MFVFIGMFTSAVDQLGGPSESDDMCATIFSSSDDACDSHLLVPTCVISRKPANWGYVANRRRSVKNSFPKFEPFFCNRLVLESDPNSIFEDKLPLVSFVVRRRYPCGPAVDRHSQESVAPRLET
jgi:hypothetical protein